MKSDAGGRREIDNADACLEVKASHAVEATGESASIWNEVV